LWYGIHARESLSRCNRAYHIGHYVLSTLQNRPLVVESYCGFRDVLRFVRSYILASRLTYTRMQLVMIVSVAGYEVLPVVYTSRPTDFEGHATRASRQAWKGRDLEYALSNHRHTAAADAPKIPSVPISTRGFGLTRQIAHLSIGMAGAVNLGLTQFFLFYRCWRLSGRKAWVGVVGGLSVLNICVWIVLYVEMLRMFVNLTS
jgi:hypothetical protein